VQHQDSNENLIRTHLLKNKASNAKFIGLSGKANPAQLITQANNALTTIISSSIRTVKIIKPDDLLALSG